MTNLAAAVGAIGTGLVLGRVQADRTSVEVAPIYHDEPLLAGALIPHMVLQDVTVELRFAVTAIQDSRVELLVTTEELTTIRPEQISTLVLKFGLADLEPPPRTT